MFGCAQKFVFGLIEWNAACFRLGQPDLKNPIAKIQLAATADPKIRFCLGLGPFRCLCLEFGSRTD
jgi:hypothetical protein